MRSSSFADLTSNIAPPDIASQNKTPEDPSGCRILHKLTVFLELFFALYGP